jgi:hypothetical protein
MNAGVRRADSALPENMGHACRMAHYFRRPGSNTHGSRLYVQNGSASDVTKLYHHFIMYAIHAPFHDHLTPMLHRTLGILLCIIVCVHAQQTQFKVSRLKGQAQIQRSGETRWEKLRIGHTVEDNDIVRSQFQTQLALSFGRGNILSLGSNSKILVNIEQDNTDRGEITVASVTLLKGGVLAQALYRARVNIYTSNAVAETDSGIVSAVLEEKTGKTGFQVIRGSADTRNIAQRRSQPLQTGQTTMILPGKEPTAPLYMTNQHVQVMGKFFGDEYIQRQIDDAGIEPTTNYRSQLQYGSREQKASAHAHMQKRQFTLNRAYSAILDDKKSHMYTYTPITGPALPDTGHPLLLEAHAHSLMYAGGVQPSVQLRAAFHTPNLYVKARLGMHSHARGTGLYQFSSLYGIASTIQRFDLFVPLSPDTSSRVHVHAGTIRDLRIARGALVDHYSNENPYAVFAPTGVVCSLTTGFTRVTALLGDVAALSHGGLYARCGANGYWAGIGYMFDRTSRGDLEDEHNSRFFPVENIVHDTTAATAHFLTAGFGADLIDDIDLYLGFYADCAQRIAANTVEGYVCHVPGLRLKWRTLEGSLHLVSEAGRMVQGLFGPRYAGTRTLFYPTGVDNITYSYITDSLARTRRANGLATGFGIRPHPHVDIRSEVTAYFSTTGTFRTDTLNDTLDIHNTRLRLQLAIDDSLVPGIAHASLTAHVAHGSLFPAGGGMFNTANSLLQFKAMSKPLLYNMYFSGGIDLGAADIHNGSEPLADADITPYDLITRIYVGIGKGVL